MSKRLILIIISLTLLSSCGFKLRGNFRMSPALSTITVDGGDRDLRELIIDQLERSGSQVVDAGGGAATLLITRNDFDRTVRTKNADGLATGYDYRYTVDFSVTDAEGENLQSPDSIIQQRTLNYDPEETLEVEEEEDFLREEIEKEIVLQLMRRLSRI